MRVLILGARGMLGHALTDAFAGNEVLAWDRGQLDITDELNLNERLSAVEPDLVVNAAAFTDVDRAEQEPEEADAVNGHAVGNLGVTCGELHIPLLHVSTECVFGQEVPEGYAESDEPVHPLNAYGRSKLLGETLLRESGTDAWLVRTAWLFGLHGRNFVTKIIEASQKTNPLPVVDDVVGSPTYTCDLARAVVSLVRDRAPFGTYHLVNGGTPSRAEFAEEILRLRDLPVKVQRVSSTDYTMTAPRQRISILKNTKRPPLRPWQEALAQYLQELAL